MLCSKAWETGKRCSVPCRIFSKTKIEMRSNWSRRLWIGNPKVKRKIRARFDRCRAVNESRLSRLASTYQPINVQNVPTRSLRKGDALLSRVVSSLIGGLFTCLSLAGSAASPQNQYPSNVFFGFEFVLQPLAVKWACGGQRDQDLAQINALIVAFPEDAKQAEIGSIIVTLSDMADGLDILPKLIGIEITGQQVEQLCAAALPLNIDWLTPEHFNRRDESEVPVGQETGWADFFAVVEGFQ